MLASPRLALIVPGFVDTFDGLLLADFCHSGPAAVGQESSLRGSMKPEAVHSKRENLRFALGRIKSHRWSIKVAHRR